MEQAVWGEDWRWTWVIGRPLLDMLHILRVAINEQYHHSDHSHRVIKL